MISDVRNYIDPQQFGSLKGSSTTYCLLDMLHSWLSHSDPLVITFAYVLWISLKLSIVLVIISHGLQTSYIPGRRLCVKLGEAIFSWLPVKVGVPQWTKLGSTILFLIMVNKILWDIHHIVVGCIYTFRMKSSLSATLRWRAPKGRNSCPQLLVVSFGHNCHCDMQRSYAY